MKNKLLVYILGGGVSAEHEVSLKTANAFYNHIDRGKYEPMAITISKRGDWQTEGEVVPAKKVKAWIKDNKPDVVLLGIHGTGYEDGQIQALFEKLAIPFTGSGSKASQLAFDKQKTKDLLEKEGLQVALGVLIKKKEFQNASKLTSGLNFPFFVKPNQNGSSVATTRVSSLQELKKALDLVWAIDRSALIEQEVKGRELSCGVIQNGDTPIVLPPTEIRSPGEFFSYQAKYSLKLKGGAEELTPAPLTQEQTEQVQAVATVAHEALNCRGITRTDMILNPSGELFVLEINTLPGMTETSLVPQQAKVAGLNLKQIVDLLIEDAIS